QSTPQRRERRSVRRLGRPGPKLSVALLAVRIKPRKLAPAQEDRFLRQAAVALDPGAHSGRIGRGDEARLVRRRILPALLIDPARSMEAEDGPRRDTDTVLRDRAQHQRAGR